MSGGRRILPAARERAPDPKVIKWNGVKVLHVSLARDAAMEAYGPWRSSVGSSHKSGRGMIALDGFQSSQYVLSDEIQDRPVIEI
jgi:hypothetical protein